MEGLPVILPRDREALSVTIDGQTITAFTYYCRSYSVDERESALLPPSMATAIAALHSGAGLSIGYVDNGLELLTAQWLSG